MFFSLFNKNSECIEKEMDNLLEKEDDEIREDNKLVKVLTYLQDLIKI
jgi:hypothetical protein